MGPSVQGGYKSGVFLNFDNTIAYILKALQIDDLCEEQARVDVQTVIDSLKARVETGNCSGFEKNERDDKEHIH